MRMTKHIGVILLAVWLILTGLVSVVGLALPGLGLVLGILAIAAGVALLMLGGRARGMTRDVGVILLAVWLILTGLFSILPTGLPGLGLVIAILALAAGLVLLFASGYLRGRGGIILLSIWLIFSALMTLVGLSFAAAPLIMGIIALAAGVLLLVEQ
jgi:hypothetical protein